MLSIAEISCLSLYLPTTGPWILVDVARIEEVVMGFTDEQLNEVDAALVTKVIGKRKTRVAYGDKAIDYSDVDFDKEIGRAHV